MRAVRKLPWIADGIEVREKDYVEEIMTLAIINFEAAKALINKPWLQDGLNDTEHRAIFFLIDISVTPWAHETARSIANMPFLDTFELTDSLAIIGLMELTKRGQDDRHFQEIWNHPAVRDGIDDDEAEVLVGLLVTGWDEYDPESLETLKLLDSKRFEVERRIIDLPLANEVAIEIYRRHGTGWSGTMDQIEKDFRLLEEFMSSPLPEQRAIYVISRNNLFFGTRNTGDYIFMVAHGEARNSESTYTHEAAHYYWDKGYRWISEGAAVFLEDVGTSVDGNSSVVPSYRVRGRCAEVRNISELERARDIDVRHCDYSMGALLFHDLYRSIDETTFRQSFRHLYLLSRHDDPNDQCSGTDLDICHVRAAFTKFVPGEDQAAINKVIDKWYLGHYPRYWIDGSPCPDKAIRGTVLGLVDGIWATRWHRLESIEFTVWRFETPYGSFSTDQFDGSFQLCVPDRSVINITLDGFEETGVRKHLGYLGEDGLTHDFGQRKRFIVDGQDIEGIEISLTWP